MITDFGLSKMEQNGIMSTACGTPGYVGELGQDFVLVELLRKGLCTSRTRLAEGKKCISLLVTTRGSQRHCTDPVNECRTEKSQWFKNAKKRVILRAI